MKFKQVIIVVGSTVSALIAYWKGLNIAMQTLLICMTLDYVTGLILATVFNKSSKSCNGGLSSAAGFRGIFKKVAVLMIVVIAWKLDQLLNLNYIYNMTVIAYIINEVISLTENVTLMGVPIPNIVIKALDIVKEKEKAYEKD